MMQAQRTIRLVVLGLLLTLVVVGVCLLFFTQTGNTLRHNPRDIGPDLLAWVQSHPAQAIAILFGLYIVLTIAALPVWWLQILAGYTLGLLWGTIWCQLAATLSAIIIVHFSRWLAADWFHQKIESRLQKLQRLGERLGHNGFLVVMTVRLVHIMPFALSNYIFGLTTIPAIDIAIGTALGGIPGVLLYVTIGAQPKLLETGKYWLAMVLLNLVLLMPIALRYLRPGWFKRIGVE